MNSSRKNKIKTCKNNSFTTSSFDVVIRFPDFVFCSSICNSLFLNDPVMGSFHYMFVLQTVTFGNKLNVKVLKLNIGCLI